MTLGEKLSKLRKQNNITQEQLAERLGVSRQAISKWESDVSYPETDKLIQLGKLYNCSMDYLLKDEIEEEQPQFQKQEENLKNPFRIRDFYFERKSKKMVGKLPLWHINIGLGRSAKGFFAVGLIAKGIFSLGFFSLGIVSLGLLAVGLVALGTVAVGVVAAGAISAGMIAFGAISFGVLSFGAMATGQFAIGALANGHYFALGDNARAMIAIGQTEAEGSLYQVLGDASEMDKEYIVGLLYEKVPKVFHWIVGIVKGVM